MNIEIKLLGPGDAHVLTKVENEVFDSPVNAILTAEFLDDPRHHLIVALEDGRVVGFVSAIHYVHPDKAPELWINEVSVASSYRRRGLAKRLLESIFALGRFHGCNEAWVGTERSNLAAMALYTSVGGAEPLPDPVYFTFSLIESAGEGAGEGKGKRSPEPGVRS